MVTTLPLARIIPDKQRKLELLFLGIVLLLAAFFRLWGIGQRTEFLGDQGRTGIILYEALLHRSIPLVGPTVLSGEHLGPFFYYLIGPAFIVSRFNPAGPAVLMAFFGVLSVYLLIRITSELFGKVAGIAAGIVYALSPAIVTQDRIIWEPNLVPFFALLYLFLVIRLWSVRGRWLSLGLGAVVGILVQLHYPNVFFVFLTALFWFGYVIRNRKMKTVDLMILIGVTVTGFLIAIAPFLYYEFAHKFVDIGGIASVFLGNKTSLPRRVILHNFVDFTVRVIGRVVPISSPSAIPIIVFLLMLALTSQHLWFLFCLGWFVAAIAAMSLYGGVVYDHYLNFVLPLPFIFFGAVVAWLRKFVPVTMLTVILLVLFLFHLTKSDVLSAGYNDIQRTRSAVGVMQDIAKDQAFSFTLLTSRSFSDLHYRYFFLFHGRSPESITNPRYGTLFLVCDKSPCPPIDTLSTRKVQVICYDQHCSGEYPTVDLRGWGFEGARQTEGATIYVFKRRSLYLSGPR